RGGLRAGPNLVPARLEPLAPRPLSRRAAAYAAVGIDDEDGEGRRADRQGGGGIAPQFGPASGLDRSPFPSPPAPACRANPAHRLRAPRFIGGPAPPAARWWAG